MIKKKAPLWMVVFKLSRPHFWAYLAGSYLIGYTALANAPRDFFRFEFFYTLFFFLIPANIILYGINNIYDKNSDNNNKKLYLYSIGASLLLSLPLWFYLSSFSKLLLAMFLLLSVFYSAKPFRLKAKPYVDSLSNILYAFPGFIAVYQLTNIALSPLVFIAIICWTTAMHLFSTIPDIEEDKHSHLRTTAVILGKRKSLFVCAILWLLSGVISVIINPYLFFMLVYPAALFYLLGQRRASIEDLSWKFPIANTVILFLLYLVVVLT